MYSILLVDDDALFQFDLQEQLEALSFQVLVASSYKEGLELLHLRFDLAVFDYKLPDGNGLQLLEALKKLKPLCPAIILTAYADESFLKESIRHDNFQLLDKLDDKDHIIPTIKAVIEFV